jgi:hypothetical protein
MKKIRIFSFFILLCLLFTAASPAALALEAPAVTAQSWIIVDLNTGEVIAEQNADAERSPASLTKIMTGLLAVEAVESEADPLTMDEIVTAGYDCQTGLDSSSSNASIVAGEKMSFRDFFYCAMVVSANEACNVLGSRISGSIGGFVDLMNRRAEELGLSHTHFADPNGLSSENRTTARELSLILQEALQHGFRSVTHLFNGMGAFNHREPGTIGSALALDEYSCELICDNIHSHPAAQKIAWKAKGRDKVVLITDMIRPSGLPDGHYVQESTGMEINVSHNGTELRIPSGALAGSALTMDRGLRNFTANSGADLDATWPCSSLNAARLIGISHETGSIEKGKLADLVLMDPEFNVKRTIIEGHTAFINEE